MGCSARSGTFLSSAIFKFPILKIADCIFLMQLKSLTVRLDVFRHKAASRFPQSGDARRQASLIRGVVKP